jgi:ferrous iron transport protein B
MFQKLFMAIWHSVSHETLRNFLIYGFFASIGGFLVYVPNIMLLFLFSHILHQSGLAVYAGNLLDPLFRVFGLRGSAFQPLMFGFGCSVNALHSAQTIKSFRQRVIVMLIAPFMSCGAKFGVYVICISMMFSRKSAGTVLFGMYAAGILFSLLSSLLFNNVLALPADDTTEEALSLPRIQMPPFLPIIKNTLHDGWIFCSRAGTAIVAASMIIWALSYWPGIPPEKYEEMVSYARENDQRIPSRMTLSLHASYLAAFGQFIEPVFRPMGQDWKNALAIVSSFTGRNVIISTLITLYGIEGDPEHQTVLVHALRADPAFSRLSALTLMVFILFCGGCLASIAMFYHATKSWFFTALFVLYPLVCAWIISVLVYQGGRLVQVMTAAG